MRQRAVVVGVSGDTAVIEPLRAVTCGECEKNSGCRCRCDLSRADLTGKRKTSYALNKVNAKAGDLVEIAAKNKRDPVYAALVFILPIIICAAFYIIGNALFKTTAAGNIAAAAGFALTAVPVFLIDTSEARRPTSLTIVRIIGNSGANIER